MRGVRANRRDVEGPIQEAIVEYLRKVIPGAIVHHTRNEINKRGVHIAKELAKATKRGSVKGFTDIIVILEVAVGVIFFEVKPHGRYADTTQKALHEQLRALGYHVAVVRSIDDVRVCLIEWGVGFSEAGIVSGIDFRGQIT